MFKKGAMISRVSMLAATCLLVVTFLSSCVMATASDFPTRPLKIIVPWSPGGATDTMARALASVAPDVMGQPLIVVNKPGGAGVPGMAFGAKAKPDGYTLTAATSASLATPQYFREIPYSLDDFIPICQVYTTPIVLVVRADSPWKTLQDFLDEAREKPGRITYGHAGVGTTVHLVGEAINLEAGVKLAQTPFGGSAPALAALMGGHVDSALVLASEVVGYVEGGELRVLGVAAKKRFPLLPDAPTFKEQEYPNILGFAYKGVVVPAGTPEDRVAYLRKAFAEMVKHPAFVKLFKKLKIPLDYLPGEECRQSWEEVSNFYGDIIKRAGIKLKK